MSHTTTDFGRASGELATGDRDHEFRTRNSRKLDVLWCTDIGEGVRVRARYWAVDASVLVPVGVNGGVVVCWGAHDDAAGGDKHEAGWSAATWPRTTAWGASSRRLQERAYEQADQIAGARD